MMQIEKAKALAEQIDDAARALNKAIADAASAGLLIDLTVLNVGQLGMGDVPFVDVIAKVKPSDISA